MLSVRAAVWCAGERYVPDNTRVLTDCLVSILCDDATYSDVDLYDKNVDWYAEPA